MNAAPAGDRYSIREVARAAGVPEEQVLACLSGGRVSSSGTGTETRPGGVDPVRFLTHAEAVRVGVALQLRRRTEAATAPTPLFSIFSTAAADLRSRRVFALSSTVHAAALAIAVFVASVDLAPHAAAFGPQDPPHDVLQLVFLATPGPGGGGGGGGLREPTPAPRALREGHQRISSPAPPSHRIAPAPIPPRPQPIASEPLPTLVAPIVASPTDPRTRAGVLEETTAQNDAHGPGADSGAGAGAGAGLGAGTGPGVGPGSGGGIGGGPYRPGSGIEPPRLLREVKGDYTEEARRRGISGEVVMEIVVRRDGSVGDVKILQALGSGLDDRAVQAVRQWRFAPAQKQNVPVDVLVEVAMEFKLR